MSEKLETEKSKLQLQKLVVEQKQSDAKVTQLKQELIKYIAVTPQSNFNNFFS